MAGLAAYALTIGGFEAALVAFANAAVTMVLLMFGLALALATAQERLVATLQARASEVKRWGGWILLLVGGWFLVLAIFADFFAQIFPV